MNRTPNSLELRKKQNFREISKSNNHMQVKFMLYSGLYEQVINKLLGSEIAVTDKLRRTTPIDSGESSKILAKYIVDIIKKGLDNVRDRI